MTTAVYHTTFPATNRSRSARYLVMCGLLSFMGMVMSTSTYINASLADQPINWRSVLLAQLLPQLIWCGLLPVVVRLDHRIRSRAKAWPRMLAIHFPAAIAMAAIQTSLFGLIYWPLTAFSTIRYSSLAHLYQSIGLGRFMIGIICYKLIVTTNYALDYYEKYREEKRRSTTLEAQLAHAQLQALKMQLQPHFLFNALNSISSLVLEEPRVAVHMIARLGDFLRLTIENNGTQVVSLERELEFLRCYLEIEQVRFRDRLRVRIDAEPETMKAQVPNLILQPIIENAIKHGIAARAAAGQIEVSVKRREEKLRIEVSDDGPGPAFGKPIRIINEGVGLANTRERLRQLYGDDFCLSLNNRTGGGTAVTIEIPFIAEEAVESGATEETRRGDRLWSPQIEVTK